VLAGNSAEEEIIANNTGALKLKWIKMLEMIDLGSNATETVLHRDNGSCIEARKYSRSSGCTIHIDGKFKKVEELVKK
jgi:hypothetical protein